MSASGKTQRDLAPGNDAVAKGKSKPGTPEAATPFKSDEEVLEDALAMVRSLDDCSSFARRPVLNDRALVEMITQRACDLARVWHKRLSLTPESIFIAGLCRRLRLIRIEREVLVALLLDAMGLNPIHLGDASDLMQLFALRKSGALAAQQAVSESGKLYRKGIVFYDDPDAELRDRKVLVDPGILQSALRGRGAATPFTALKREEDLHEALDSVTGAMKHKSDEMKCVMQGQSQADFQKHQRKLAYLLRQLDEVLKQRPQWKLGHLRSKFKRGDQDWLVVLALLGKALLHVEPEDALFTGAGLSRAISESPKQVKGSINRLLSNAALVQRRYIQPCGGNGSLISESPESIAETEFELTEEVLALLGIEQSVGPVKARDKAL